MTCAFLFPGQGSQAVGMGAELLAAGGVAKETFDEASEALGFDMAALCSEGPADELNRTENTQPALLVTSVAALRHHLANGGAGPAVVAGHSLGEYSALVAAGAVAFADAVKLVRRRGQLMQEAGSATPGMMAALIGLDLEPVEALCAEATTGADSHVQPANINAPGQIVIAGHVDAVERAMAAAKDAGAKRALPLKVSVAAHSSLMAPAREAFADLLAEVSFRVPTIPVLQNATLASPASVDELRSALADQLVAPVNWIATIARLTGEHGVTRAAECGAGAVLAGLVKRIDRALPVAPFATPDDIAAFQEETA